MNNEMVLFKLLKSPHGQANKMIQRAVSPVGGLTTQSWCWIKICATSFIDSDPGREGLRTGPCGGSSMWSNENKCQIIVSLEQTLNIDTKIWHSLFNGHRFHANLPDVSQSGDFRCQYDCLKNRDKRNLLANNIFKYLLQLEHFGFGTFSCPCPSVKTFLWYHKN